MLPKHVVNYLTHTLIPEIQPALFSLGQQPSQTREGQREVYNMDTGCAKQNGPVGGDCIRMPGSLGAPGDCYSSTG